MRWDRRQQAMLREMGIRLWLPDAEALAPAQPVEAARVPQRGAAVRAAEAVVEAVAAAPASVAPVAMVATREDLATLDASALAARAAVCTACALSAGRSRPVFSAGRERADWMVVGEAPDPDDDRAGTPFAGRAGQLVANMLNAVGLPRGEAGPSPRVHLTHAVKCAPPGARLPEPAEVAACAAFLQRQVQLVQPRIIVAMGRAAAQGLLGTGESVGKLRGRVHSCQGIPVIVTDAPGYLMRHPQAKAEAWDDLCLAVETVMTSRPG